MCDCDDSWCAKTPPVVFSNSILALYSLLVGQRPSLTTLHNGLSVRSTDCRLLPRTWRKYMDRQAGLYVLTYLVLSTPNAPLHHLVGPDRPSGAIEHCSFASFFSWSQYNLAAFGLARVHCNEKLPPCEIQSCQRRWCRHPVSRIRADVAESARRRRFARHRRARLHRWRYSTGPLPPMLVTWLTRYRRRSRVGDVVPVRAAFLPHLARQRCFLYSSQGRG